MGLGTREPGNMGMQGQGDAGTRGRRDSGTWDAKMLGRGMWDVETRGHDKQTVHFGANCKVQFSVLSRKILYLFSTRKRAKFNNSCNLIGSWSGRNFLAWTALKGGIRLVDLFQERISGYPQLFHFYTSIDDQSTQVYLYSPLDGKESHSDRK